MDQSISYSTYGKFFNTLGQTGTGRKNKPLMKVQGIGSDLTDLKALKSRSRRKLITNKSVLALIDIAYEKGDLKKYHSLWRTYHCQARIVSQGTKLYTKYCKNRFCTQCCCIRKAEIINKYLPVIQAWESPCFVTLTVKVCKKMDLDRAISKVVRAFHLIIDRLKKRNQRGQGPKPVGIRSLECNFNRKNRTYNPHIHLVVQSEELARLLIDEWLKQWPRKYVYWKAQHMSRAKNNEQVLIEIIKYGTKIFTEPDPNNKTSPKKENKICAAAMYNIFNAMSKHRIFDRFGFNLPKTQRTAKGTTQYLADYQEWFYNQRESDWKCSNLDQPLTQFQAPPELISLLDFNIDKISE